MAKASFLASMKADPGFAQALSDCLAKRYAHALMLRELVGIKNAKGRQLTWLHWQGPSGQQALDLKGRMGSLAPELGLSLESVYRAFARLKEEGEIRVEDGQVQLLNHPTELLKKNRHGSFFASVHWYWIGLRPKHTPNRTKTATPSRVLHALHVE